MSDLERTVRAATNEQLQKMVRRTQLLLFYGMAGCVLFFVLGVWVDWRWLSMMLLPFLLCVISLYGLEAVNDERDRRELFGMSKGEPGG